jgi:hypothetical protein
MCDATPLREAVDRLADRFRALPASRLARVAPAGLALARELSVLAQRLELPGREPVLMPDDGMYAIGDQLAVAGHDLAAALQAATGRHDRCDLRDAALGRVADVAGQV